MKGRSYGKRVRIFGSHQPLKVLQEVLETQAVSMQHKLQEWGCKSARGFRQESAPSWWDGQICLSLAAPAAKQVTVRTYAVTIYCLRQDLQETLHGPFQDSEIANDDFGQDFSLHSFAVFNADFCLCLSNIFMQLFFLETNHNSSNKFLGYAYTNKPARESEHFFFRKSFWPEFSSPFLL